MRTKLRLDLADVRRQIEDLEDLLNQDKSPENVEAHRKLVEYEKKLKEQYEAMTGLTVEKATKLEPKVKIAVGTKSTFSGFIGLLSGLLIAWGFYNAVLHSVDGFDPLAVVDYFTGNGASTSSIDLFMTSLLYESSLYLVTIPIAAGSALIAIAALLDKTRSKKTGIFEGLAFLITSGYFSYLLLTSDSVAAGVDTLEGNLLYYSVAVVFSGVLLLISAIGQRTGFLTMLSIFGAILFAYTGAQLLLITQNATSLGDQMVFEFPWIFLPLVISSFLIAVTHFMKMFRT